MKNHTKIYFDFFGYAGEDAFVPCEMCGAKAVDIHHIERRGMGGDESKDEIENLIALCRLCHITLGDKKQYKDLLRDVHKKRMARHEKTNRARGVAQTGAI
jgi:hypothetical protein